MDLTELAEQLDGRAAVAVRPHLFRAADDEARWVCWLYGYRIAEVRRAGPDTELLAVADPDPGARARGAWMRRPDLDPGGDPPVPWTRVTAARPNGAGAPPVWTPPGWPPGHAPVRPAPGRMPGPTPGQAGAGPEPSLLLLLAALFGVLAALFAATRPAGAVLLLFFAAGSLAAYPFARHRRERLVRRAVAEWPPGERAG
ncbi:MULTISPECIES: hypothetical protein [unclassified Kitasatospora]|uniref:hypothetical protein n=1 Tax=unclassified Kitasatospora TaxID=2633591 RepID=UPI00382769C2